MSKASLNPIGVALSPTPSRFGPLLYAGSLEKGMEAAAELGYDGVELSIRDSQEIDQERIAERLHQLGLTLFAIATGQSYVTDGFSIFGQLEENRRGAEKRLMNHIDFASGLEAHVIVGGIVGNIDETAADPMTQYLRGMESLHRLVQNAQRKGVTLLLEAINRYESNIINTVKDGLLVLKELGSNCVKLLLDTFHMNLEEPSIPGALQLAGERLGYVHLADSNRRAPGTGHLNFVEILYTLQAIGYSGPITCEILPQPDDSSAAAWAINYLRSIQPALARNREEPARLALFARLPDAGGMTE